LILKAIIEPLALISIKQFFSSRISFAKCPPVPQTRLFHPVGLGMSGGLDLGSRAPLQPSSATVKEKCKYPWHNREPE